MNKDPLPPTFPVVALLFLLGLAPPASAATAARSIGVARIDVTPSEPIRLTGYGSRTTNSTGVEQKLWAKALALGSDRDGPAVLLTLDNCGITEETYLEIVARLRKKGVPQERLAIACSHTHSGPCTTRWAPNIFSRDIAPDQQAAINRYTRDLIDKLEQVALAALKDRRPGHLAWSQGSVGFARNRRVVVGKTAQFGDNAAGPVDHALPVLLASDPDGKIRAVVANYACHCTTLGGEFNQVCGDWAGYAQEAIERDHPGAVALITIGCGADANPSPRGGPDGGLALAKRHGEELAAETKRLLSQTFTPLPAKLITKLKHIDLPFGPHFSRDQWQARATNSGIVGYHAKKWLDQLNRGEKLPNTLSYYVQTWSFGDDLALVFLNGEVVVDYALRLKNEFDPQRLWITSYANYVPCYIPSRRILAEGGYEAEGSLWYYDRPARLSTNAEDLIIKTVHELMPKSFRTDPKKAEFPDPKTPQQALGTFRTHADLVVELVASEPLIQSPVAIDWGADGRLWVCEMFDYPTGVDSIKGADSIRRGGRSSLAPSEGERAGVRGQPAPYAGHEWGKNPPAAYTPGGRIKILSSSKGDGRYDKATLFLDGLPFPTGVMPWRKGALICAAPDILYAEDTNGDGRADLVRTNFTGFAMHNYQARVNGFTWGLDGWLHGSSGLFGGKVKSLLTGQEVDLSGRDFRFKPDTGEIEPVAGLSQMGRVRDDFDNWFGNDNSTLLWHYPLPEHYLRRNPHVTYPDLRVNVASARAQGVSGKVSEPVSGKSDTAAIPSRSPAHRLTHSPDPNRLYPISRALERYNHPESANRVTGACGPCIYRDELLGPGYYGNAFICEPVHNLVTRLVLEPDGVTFAGRRAPEEERSEFLASTDNWFRPVQARTGPDGALWIVDMYRFVIEHPRWIAPERLKDIDVRAGAEMGRIYRVYPKGAKLRPVRDLTSLSVTNLAEALFETNGLARDLVHRELLSRPAHEPLPLNKHDWQSVERWLWQGPLRYPTEQEWRTMHPAIEAQLLAAAVSFNYVRAPEMLAIGALSNDPRVRRVAVALHDETLRQHPDGPGVLPTLLEEYKGAMAHIGPMDNEENPAVRLQLALTLGEWNDPRAAQLLVHLAKRNELWIRAAVLSSAANWPGAILKTHLAETAVPDGSFVSQLFATAVGSPDPREWQRMLKLMTPTDPIQRWQWIAIAGLFESLQRHQNSILSLSTSTREEDRDAAGRLQKFLTAAMDLAANAGADEATRKAAVRVLGFSSGNDRALETLIAFLQPGTPPGLQNVAIETLRRQRDPRTVRALLGDWGRQSPGFRIAAISLLLSREIWTGELLKAVEQSVVSPGEIPPSDRQRLLKHNDTALRERAVKLLASLPSASRAEILPRYDGVKALSAAPDHGAALFDQNCAQCHAFRGRGHAVGPNLAEYAGKTPQDFLLAILDPNAALNPNFLAYDIETKDGRNLSGIVRGETASGLTLMQAGGLEEKVLRNDIREIRANQLSLMPEGLEQALSPQDMADLIAWVKQSAPAPFGSATPEQAARARSDFLKSGMNGFAKVIICVEELPYPSWLGRLPMPYCRQNAGQNKLVWETAPVAPAGSVTRDAVSRSPARSGGTGRGEGAAGVHKEGPFATFRLPAAMGFISQPSGHFTLKLNGQALLVFDVTLSDQSWRSADGRVQMRYEVKEANTEDSNGVLLIEVPADLLKPGEPARFEVVGSASNSQRWFGLYRVEP